jgi:histidyl-tRNA synthetase
VGGGGRYDHLLADLTGVQLPAVGFGIGFDRTVEAAVALNLLPQRAQGPQVLVTIFETPAEQQRALEITTDLRAAGIRAELYPATEKLPKQLKLANQKQIPFVMIIGETEVQANQVTLRDMTSGEQITVDLSEAIRRVQSAPQV